ncbi:MAG: hypothetical protein A3K60_08855 [Euryarchaeota archaeon RBG_19FT_COMBO_56_21]|nr:MAG: hypothetical protein A3K60_08855 [Euryarchaeota archaeon RBG_19FT_COMBO_56_21]
MKVGFVQWSDLRAQMFVAGALVLGIIGFGTVIYHFMEGWSWVSSFYFAVCTITTVGYGELHPTTELSQLFTAIYALVGVGVAFTALGVIGANYLRKSQELMITIRDGGKKSP